MSSYNFGFWKYMVLFPVNHPIQNFCLPFDTRLVESIGCFWFRLFISSCLLCLLWLSNSWGWVPEQLYVLYDPTYISHIQAFRILEKRTGHFHSLSLIKQRTGLGITTVSSISCCRAYWQANFLKGFPIKMNDYVLLLLPWDCYTRHIKWIHWQSKIALAYHVCNCNLAPQNEIYQEKNDDHSPWQSRKLMQ